MELLDVHDVYTTEDRSCERGSSEGRGELFGGENGFVVLRIYGGVATTSLFKVDVPTSSQGIGFGTEFPRSEADDEVELGEVFGPSGLSSGEELGSGEVREVLVISHDVNRSSGAFEEVPPALEGFEDCKEFFVVDIVIEFRFGERTGVECDGMNFVVDLDGEDCCKSVVGGVGFHDKRSIRTPLSEDRSGGEGFLEIVKGLLASFRPDPRSILAG